MVFFGGEKTHVLNARYAKWTVIKERNRKGGRNTDIKNKNNNRQV